MKDWLPILTTISFLLVSYLQGNTTTITVDSTHATMGTISLRTAVASSVSGDTIRFSSTIDSDTIKLGGMEITLNKNLVIIGNDTTSTIIDGQNTSRIFHIPSGNTVSISGVKMQNGNGASPIQPFSGTHGGAIYNQGTLTLTNCAVSGNSANSGGGDVQLHWWHPYADQ